MSILLAFGFALLIGFFNGYIVIKTGLPSFIVTLAFLYILRGLTIGLSRLLTNRTLIGGIKHYTKDSWLAQSFGGEIAGIPMYFED